MITCTQVDPSRILLAYNDEGCASLCLILRQMLEVQQFHQAAVRKTDTYDSTLAVRTMGTRHHGPIPDGDPTAEILGSRHKLLH